MKQKNYLTKENVYQEASRFSLSALEIAERNTIDQFKPRVFELLKEYVYFDAGQWVTRAVVDADNKRVHPSGAYLESLNNNKLLDYQPYIKQDRLFTAVIESPNITHDLRNIWPDEEYFKSSVYDGYGKKYGLERALCTLVYREHNNFCQIISLYREQRINLFAEPERMFVELVCQYMSSALRLNILKNVAGDINQPKLKPKAVTDADGFIFESDANFLNWLQQCYPDFDGRYLPLSLLHKANTGELINQDLFSLSVNQVGDLFLISRVSSLDINKLSEKETNIVLSLAKGGSNKSIAREFNNSKTTIDTHLRNIYDKLGFSKSMDNHEKRRQLIMMATESPNLDEDLESNENTSFLSTKYPLNNSVDKIENTQKQKVLINIEKRLLNINDQIIKLSPKEFALLLWIIDKEEINLNEINKDDIRDLLKFISNQANKIANQMLKKLT